MMTVAMAMPDTVPNMLHLHITMVDMVQPSVTKKPGTATKGS